MLGVLVEVLLPIAVVALAGIFLRRAFTLDLTTLNRVMFYALSPTLVFVSLVSADLSGSGAIRMIGYAVLLVLVLGIVTAALAWPFGIRGRDLSALLLAVLFMNSGNYGLPAARFAFGEEGFTQALFYFIAQSVMAQTVGVAVAAAGSSNAAGIGGALRTAFGKVVRTPQIFAVAAAFAVRLSGFDVLNDTGAAASLFKGMQLLSDAALPLMLLILGVQLATAEPIDAPGMVSFAVILRLVISPLIALALVPLLGFPASVAGVALMLAGMPTAVNTTITAVEFRTRPQLVVSTVVVSSFLSLLTLSFLLTYIRGF
jgi:malate permease and related proteins